MLHEAASFSISVFCLVPLIGDLGPFRHSLPGGMCGNKGYGFLAVLVINRVWILGDFGHFGHK